ncbi:DNA repair protein RAD16, partial [Spiromyces aspiralis]
IRPDSTEAFILRLYRESNEQGFTKALSDAPTAFTTGFAPLEKILKALKLRRVHLWPRFHTAVKDSLQPPKPSSSLDTSTAATTEVIELRQPLTPSMDKMQQAVLDCLKACLSELRQGTRLLDEDELKVENALFRAFDHIVRRQLAPHWHRVSRRTKQLVEDLSTLRRLLYQVIGLDCVTVYWLLEDLLVQSQPAGPAGRTPWQARGGWRRPYMNMGKEISGWMMTDSTNVLFSVRMMMYYSYHCRPHLLNMQLQAANLLFWQRAQLARSRIFQRRKLSASSTAAPSRLESLLPPDIEPVLEEQPKWGLIEKVLEEIQQKRQLSKAAGPTLIMTATASSRGQILTHLETLNNRVRLPALAGKDDRSFSPMLYALLVKYFMSKARAETTKTAAHPSSPAPASPAPSASDTQPSSGQEQGRDDERGDKRRRRVRGGSKAASSRGGHRVAASVLERDTAKIASTLDIASSSGRGADPGAIDAELLGSQSTNLNLVSPLSTLAKLDPDGENGNTPAQAQPEGTVADASEDDLDVDILEGNYGVLPPSDQVIVCQYTGQDDLQLLEAHHPSFIVLYEPDYEFVYRATHPDRTPVVYFMVYESSVEEQAYLSSIRKEKESFEKLIHEKSVMAIPHEAPQTKETDTPLSLLMRHIPEVSSRDARIARRLFPERISSRGPQIIVDVREFRSALPFTLHSKGFSLVPRTIEIGDYILCDDICVERKAIPDLISSLNHGRLYDQTKRMLQHYPIVILLIEFDPESSFSLQPLTGSELQSEISMSDLSSKLALLCIAFPKLRIVWSSGPTQTAEIFRDLKTGHSEPDIERAVGMGTVADTTDSGDAATTLGSRGSSRQLGDEYNMESLEVLQTLPGITNYKKVVKHVNSLAELFELSQERLVELLGSDKGKALYQFINENIKLTQ